MEDGAVLQTARILEDEWVNITSMYLLCDANSWWQTRLKDDKVTGYLPIMTLEML